MELAVDDVWSAREGELNQDSLVIVARSMIAARAALKGPLPDYIVSDTPLDVMCQLFVARAQGRKLGVSDLVTTTENAGVITTRWLKALSNDGLISDDIELTGHGMDCMNNALQAVSRSQWALD